MDNALDAGTGVDLNIEYILIRAEADLWHRYTSDN